MPTPAQQLNALERDRYFATLEERKADLRAKSLLDAAGVPCRHGGLSERRGDAWLALRDRLESRAGSGYIALLTGPRGTGKTQLAADLIASRCRSGHSARYVKAMDFFLAVKATFDGGSQTQRDVLRGFGRPELLVIDMVHVRGETSWEDQLLTHLVDERYDAGLDTILVSNLTESEFVKSVGEDIASRANETGGVIVCDWESFR